MVEILFRGWSLPSVRSGFKELISIDEAVDGAVRHITQVPKTISVETGSSLGGRVLASDVVSSVDVPSFNRSAVDGYAVRSSDTFGASYTNPITLRLVGGRIDWPRMERKGGGAGGGGR